MSLAQLRVTKGPQLVAEYDLNKDVSIGRKDAEIIIEDPKISSKHAKIQYNFKTKKWKIVDLKSANGIKINGRRISELELEPGVQVRLGSHKIEVVYPQEAEEKSSSWTSEIRSLAYSRRDAEEDARLQKVFQLQPSILVEFISGVQFGERNILYWGPRKFGKVDCDYLIFEPESPDCAFEIIKEGDQYFITTQNSQKVRFNQQNINRVQLSSNTVVSIGATRIKVEPTKG